MIMTALLDVLGENFIDWKYFSDQILGKANGNKYKTIKPSQRFQDDKFYLTSYASWQNSVESV